MVHQRHPSVCRLLNPDRKDFRGDQSRAARLGVWLVSLRYDDAENPLLDQPLSYIQTLSLDYGQVPCGVNDLVSQHYGYVSNSVRRRRRRSWADARDAVRLARRRDRLLRTPFGCALAIYEQLPGVSATAQPHRRVYAMDRGRRLHDSPGFRSALQVSAARIWMLLLFPSFRRVRRSAAFRPAVLDWTRNGLAAAGAQRANGRDSNTTIPISPSLQRLRPAMAS